MRPRCPFAGGGCHAPVTRCPGFAPQLIQVSALEERAASAGAVTCAHLAGERGRRGFVPACGHPDGLPPGAAAAAQAATAGFGA